MASGEFHVRRAADVPEDSSEKPQWLIESLWGRTSVGIVGGTPKSGKTWLALEMAVAVASGRPCLSRYAVPVPGPVLVYAAEDAPEQVRERLRHLAEARGAAFETLDVRLILEPQLRLDRHEHLLRLRATLARHRPVLLVLDPYVRLQRADENDATQVSAILSALRELSRAFSLAVALVHHARKNGAESPGQALRGSGDFHAWGDSNLYLSRRGEALVLSIEHRSFASPPPLGLQLVADDSGPVRLDVREIPAVPSLPERILELLARRSPRRLEDLRRELSVRKQTLLDVLREMEQARRIRRSGDGWHPIET